MATTISKQSRTASKTQLPQEPDAEPDEATAPPRKKRSLMKLMLLLALPLTGVAGGAWYLLQGQQSAEASVPGTAKSAKAAKGKQVPSKPPVFVTLDPFTVNLQREDSSAQYLQVGLSLKLRDDGSVDAIKLHMPEIRNRVLLLLSGKKAGELSTPEGKTTLSAELAREIVQPLAGGTAPAGLDSVLFTSFVIQ
jgi:flagellar protein FliL